jgi:tetratricopeptide (TPR) repeat protein
VNVIAALAVAAGFATCDAAVSRAPRAIESWLCYRRVARGAGRLEDAARRLAARLARDGDNHAARLAFALVQMDLSRERAGPLLRTAADGFAARGDAEGEVRACLGLASFVGLRGQREEANRLIDRALAVAARASDPVLRGQAGTRSAGRHYRDGDFGRARRILEEVEETLFPNGPREHQASWLLMMGNVVWAIGSAEETARCWERAVALLHADGDLYEEAKVRANILFVTPDLKRSREERLALARDLRQVAVASGNRWAEAQAYRELAQLTSGTDRIAHARRFLALARETKQRVDIAEALRLLGLYVSRRDPAHAVRLFDEAMSVSRSLANPALDAWNWMVRSEGRWRSGPRGRAIADSLAALDTIERMRNLQPDTLVRARTFARWAAPYTRLVGHLLAGHLLEPGERVTAGDVEAAFRVTERRRARVLLDGLDAARAMEGRAGGGTAARRGEVLDAIAAVQRRLVDPATGEETRRATLSELERLEREEEALRDALARADPRFALPPPARLASLAGVEAALAADEALLSYQIAPRVSATDDEMFEGGSWVFVVTRDTARAVPVDETALAALPIFLGLFDRRDGSEMSGSARLFHGLLEPALATLPASFTRLVVIPDGALHQLPLAALRSDRDAAPLGARYEVTLAPSATVWVRLRRAGSPAIAPALALADPELAAAGPEASSERAWALSEGARLGRLPHARQESRFLVRALGGGSALRLGPEATERFLKSTDLRRYAVLHLAAHALVDDEKPERSAVLLAPGAADEDGLLQIREIVGLDLAGRVVVLSACRSASGPVLSGEGVIGLAQAFFQAGARTVVGSLWPLRDDEAERVFRAFYSRLAEGKTVAAALAAARRGAIRDGLPAAAWAGLAVLGDGDVVPVPGGRALARGPVWALPVLVALIALAGRFIFRRRHR